MFQLPYHFNNVVQCMVIGWVVGLLLVAWGYFGLKERLFVMRMTCIIFFLNFTVPKDKDFRNHHIMVMVLGGIMMLTGLFFTLIYVGIIENGEPPPLPYDLDNLRLNPQVD